MVDMRGNEDEHLNRQTSHNRSETFTCTKQTTLSISCIRLKDVHENLANVAFISFGITCRIHQTK